MAELDEEKVEEIQEVVMALARDAGQSEEEIRQLGDMVPGLVTDALVEDIAEQARLQADNAEYQADEQRDEADAVSEEIEAEARRMSIDFLHSVSDVLETGRGSKDGSGGSTPVPDPFPDNDGNDLAQARDGASESETETLEPSECSPTRDDTAARACGELAQPHSIAPTEGGIWS